MLGSTGNQYLDLQRWPCSVYSHFWGLSVDRAMISERLFKFTRSTLQPTQDHVLLSSTTRGATRPQYQEPVSKVKSNIQQSSIPHGLGGWVV